MVNFLINPHHGITQESQTQAERVWGAEKEDRKRATQSEKEPKGLWWKKKSKKQTKRIWMEKNLHQKRTKGLWG